MTAKITAARTGRTWYGRPVYAVTLTDSTGQLIFNGFTRRDATMLTTIFAPLVGNRPIGAIANIIATQVIPEGPRPGRPWNIRF